MPSRNPSDTALCSTCSFVTSHSAVDKDAAYCTQDVDWKDKLRASDAGLEFCNCRQVTDNMNISQEDCASWFSCSFRLLIRISRTRKATSNRTSIDKDHVSHNWTQQHKRGTWTLWKVNAMVADRYWSQILDDGAIFTSTYPAIECEGYQSGGYDAVDDVAVGREMRYHFVLQIWHTSWI